LVVGAPLILPTQSACMDIWEVLQGRVVQQRVWAFGGNDSHGDALARQKQRQPLQSTAARSVAFGTHAVAGSTGILFPREPLPVQNGVRFTSCSAGEIRKT
jgi:hypothetical protein